VTKRRQSGRSRDFARTDRVGEQIRRIIAAELARIDDERLDAVAISGVDVDADFNLAVVYFASFDPDSDDAVIAALTELRKSLKRAIAHGSRLRRTPDLDFRPDSGIRAGARIEEILRDLDDDTGSA
jgi:ribosome-binding factor A